MKWEHDRDPDLITQQQHPSSLIQIPAARLKILIKGFLRRVEAVMAADYF